MYAVGRVKAHCPHAAHLQYYGDIYDDKRDSKRDSSDWSSHFPVPGESELAELSPKLGWGLTDGVLFRLCPSLPATERSGNLFPRFTTVVEDSVTYAVCS